MAQEIFKRYEKKYLLSQEQYQALVQGISKNMQIDAYGEHTISNIYFDTLDYRMIRESIEKPIYKEKLRLRAYGAVRGDSRVFVELKKKFDGIVYKRRVELSFDEAKKYLYDGKYPSKDSQILREIDYTLCRNQLKPAAYIAYDRVAWCGKKTECREQIPCKEKIKYGKETEELRITFDRNIRCRETMLDLRSGHCGVFLLKPGEVLMEMKIPGSVPLWMSRLLTEYEIYPVSFSKYGTFYKEYLLQIYMDRGGRNCA